MVERLIFFRSLAVMLSAGIPLHEGVQLLSRSSADARAAEVYQRMADRLARGSSFSEAMTYHPYLFDRYLVGLIKMGESSGTLARMLIMISDGLEKSWAVWSKLKSSLAYPCLLVSCCLLIVMLAPSWLLEGHLRMLRESGVPLPWTTRLLMVWSAVFRPPVVALLIVGAGLLAGWVSRRRELKAAFVRRLEDIPGIGRIVKLAACARFARALAIALRAGVNVLEALQLSAEATGNQRLVEVAERVGKSVLNGSSLGEGFTETDYFVPGFSQLVESGEAVGKTDVLLELGARFYELELELAVSALTTLLEPLLLLVIGVLTAFLLTAVLQPTLSLLQTL